MTKQKRRRRATFLTKAMTNFVTKAKSNVSNKGDEQCF